MPTHDYRCHGCHRVLEMTFPLADYPYPKFVICPCGQHASQVWLTAPSIQPDPYWNPQYDKQLGVMISSKQQRDQILKEKGLVAISKEEFTRRAGDVDPDPQPEVDKAALTETALKTWNDLKYGNVPKPQTETLAEARAAVGDPLP